MRFFFMYTKFWENIFQNRSLEYFNYVMTYIKASVASAAQVIRVFLPGLSDGMAVKPL